MVQHNPMNTSTLTSYSLNNCLKQGPNLKPHAFLVLVKFCSYEIGITADTGKAFHQILVSAEDRDMLWFLWWDNVLSEHSKIHQYSQVLSSRIWADI